MTDWRLDTSSGVPLYLQLKQQIIGRIVRGDWEPGYQLPTVRQLAVDVRINVNTVSKVYQEVEREGFIRTQQGRGTFVRSRTDWSEEQSDGRGLIERVGRLVAELADAQGVALMELIPELQRLDDERRRSKA